MEAIGEFAALCPDSWTLWAETSLNVPRKAVESAARIFNHFVVDIKTTDPEIYRAYTGGDLSVALENLLYLRDTVGAGRITVRLPVIPGYVEKAQRDQSAQWLREQGFEDLDLFTYRTGPSKT
jgi:pyruvate formate lyase activating enzyme